MSMPSGIRSEAGSSPPRVGLTLSGGGFRATLFHLGVVRLLYEEKQLHKVTHICSVSGGSILAAHLGLNWERYTSANESEFNAAAGEVVDFVRSDLRGRVVRCWLFSWAALGLPRLRKRWWWRTHLLQREYDRFYRGAKLKNLVAHDRPQLHLLATSFTTGHLVTFGQCEMRFCGDLVPDPQAMPAGEVPVGLAVAASSAFPPLFPPVRVDHATFGAPVDMFPNRHYMTDGGVFDNLGIRRLLWLFKPEERLDMIVVSDAQRSLAKEYGHEYNLTLGRTARCVDLMMNRVSWFESTAAREVIEKVHGRLLYCGLPKRPEDALYQAYAPLPPEQFAVATARTDLDSFTDDEIDAIVHEGYAAARAAAEAGGVCGEWPADRKVWHPARPDRTAAYQLAGIDRRKWGLFRPSHWASWALWGLVALWVAIPISLYVWQYIRAHEAEKRDRADKYIEALRRLGEVALTTNVGARYDDRKKDWINHRDSLKKDGAFDRFLNSNELAVVERAVIKNPPPFAKGTKEKVRALALAVRTILEEELGDETFRDFQTRKQAELYLEVFDYADQIKNYDQLTQVRNSRRQFWRLYWGPLVLVQGPEAERALKAFADILGEWEQMGQTATDELKGRLKAAVEAMREAFNKELPRPLPND